MSRDIVIGIAVKIERIDKNLCALYLRPIDGKGIETRVPIYGRLDDKYIGRVVNVITKRKGFLVRTLEQKVEASDMLTQFLIPYSQVEEINSAYKNRYRR